MLTGNARRRASQPGVQSKGKQTQTLGNSPPVHGERDNVLLGGRPPPTAAASHGAGGHPQPPRVSRAVPFNQRHGRFPGENHHMPDKQPFWARRTIRATAFRERRNSTSTGPGRVGPGPPTCLTRRPPLARKPGSRASSSPPLLSESAERRLVDNVDRPASPLRENPDELPFFKTHTHWLQLQTTPQLESSAKHSSKLPWTCFQPTRF